MLEEVTPTPFPPPNDPSAAQPDRASPVPEHAPEPAASAEPSSGPGQPSLAEWKAALRAQFEAWLQSVDEIPVPAEAEERQPGLDEPALYDFYAELASLAFEVRKGNRRTVEAFSQWSTVLDHFRTDMQQLRAGMHALQQTQPEQAPRSVCLALVELADRTDRLLAAFQATPPRRWLSADGAWREVWQRQREAFDILREHLNRLLRQQGIERVHVLGQPFDPELMSAVATQTDANCPHHTVIEELLPAYRQHGEVLRLAQVKLSVHPDAAAGRPPGEGTSTASGTGQAG